MKKLTVILLITSIIFTLSACGMEVTSSKSTNEANQSSAAVSTAVTTEQAKSTATTTSTEATAEGWTKVGKTVKVGDVEYTISSIKFTKGGDIFEADEGNTYLLIDMNVKNDTAEEQAISSIMMFELKDSAGKTYDISLGGSTALDDEKIEMIDGSVAAKSEKRGGVAYEIPENATGITFTIDDVLGSESQTIKLN